MRADHGNGLNYIRLSHFLPEGHTQVIGKYNKKGFDYSPSIYILPGESFKVENLLCKYTNVKMMGILLDLRCSVITAGQKTPKDKLLHNIWRGTMFCNLPSCS